MSQRRITKLRQKCGWQQEATEVYRFMRLQLMCAQFVERKQEEGCTLMHFCGFCFCFKSSHFKERQKTKRSRSDVGREAKLKRIN